MVTRGNYVHWASKETYHFFRVTLTKIHSIKINHIWTQISFNTISEKHKIFSLQKGENTVWSRNVIFRKSQKLHTERASRRWPIHKIQKLFIQFQLRKHSVGYCLLRTPGPRGKQFLRFLKTDLLRFHPIYLLFDWIKLLFFLHLLIKNKFT